MGVATPEAHEASVVYGGGLYWLTSLEPSHGNQDTHQYQANVLHATQASSCPIFTYIHINQFSFTYGVMQSIDQSYLTQVIDSQW
jgi:hypothetical protein